MTVDHSLEKGLTRTVSQGISGLARNTVKITYHNGQEVKREVVKTEQIKEPKNKVVAMGTITSVSRSGQNLNFREARYMTASAYTYTGSRTATGKTPAVGMVAVDPVLSHWAPGYMLKDTDMQLPQILEAQLKGTDWIYLWNNICNALTGDEEP